MRNDRARTLRAGRQFVDRIRTAGCAGLSRDHVVPIRRQTGDDFPLAMVAESHDVLVVAFVFFWEEMMGSSAPPSDLCYCCVDRGLSFGKTVVF